MRIVVAGATGALGTPVVDAVRAAGHEPIPLSRSTGTDLRSGAGLEIALRGASAVIDASSTRDMSAKGSVEFFSTVTRNLLAAEQAAGVGHHVAISIIGAASVDANYYAGKAAQEALLQSQPSGWSLLRTTQFHEFAGQVAGQGRLGPLHVVPAMRSQPVSSTEVAADLVEIATGAPRGIAPDLAGPQEERLADQVRRLLAVTGPRRRVLEVPLPGAWGRAMRDGSLLPAPGARRGQQTYGRWLATQTR